MRSLPLLLLLIAGATLSLRAQENPREMPTLIDSVSYLLGVNIGKGAGKDSIPLNMQLFLHGYNDGRTGGVVIPDSTAQQVMMEFQQVMMEKVNERKRVVGERNRMMGPQFLAENRKREGVKVTRSGLQYRVLNEGRGRQPKRDDMVQVLYRGTLSDGTPFDSSLDRSTPAQFNVMGVVPGWTEALLMMKEGARWEIVLPAELGYGSQGMGESIGPDAVLVFEVELVRVVRRER